MKLKNFSKQSLAKLIGLLLTDGCVRFESRTYRIVYAGKSEELHKIFRFLIHELFHLDKFYERTDNKGVKITVYSSKKTGEYLVNLCNTFITKYDSSARKHPKINLNVFEKLNNNEMKEVFRLMYSADGGVVLGVKWHKLLNKWEFTRRVILKCSHPDLRKKYRELLRKKIEIRTKEWDSSIVIDTKKDIIKFHDDIGFVNKVRASEKSLYWNGVEKNEILRKLIFTYDYDKEFWEKYKKKQEILKFLRAA